MSASKSPGVELRPYQQEAVSAVLALWEKNPSSRTVIVAPTGSGKTLMIAHVIASFPPSSRICVLAHRSELLNQNARAIERFCGEEVGIFSASLSRKDRNARITVGGIQSIGKRHAEFGRFDLIIVDEAHLVPNAESTLYRTFLDDALASNPSLKILGLTATPYRLDSGLLYEGKKALFDSLAYEIEIPHLIEEGYLCPIVSKGGVKSIDVSNVHIRGGEYRPDELARAASDEELTRLAVEEIVRIGVQDRRRGWMLFASGIDHAEALLAELRKFGIPSEIVTGETDQESRQKIIADYKSAQVTALVNVNVLTTGFDAPHTDLIAMLRPTKSTSLYIQAVGRGMRLSPGKENCLLLDYAGVVMEHGLIDQVDPKRNGSSKDGGEEAPAKMCPSCRSFVPNATRTCLGCGYEWPKREVVHDTRAYEGAVLSAQETRETVRIRRSVFDLWKGKSGTPTVRITYFSEDGRRFSEWICPEHIGYPRTKFEKICREEWGMLGREFPTRAEEVVRMSSQLPLPSEIVIVHPPGEPFPMIKKRLYDVPF